MNNKITTKDVIKKVNRGRILINVSEISTLYVKVHIAIQKQNDKTYYIATIEPIP